MNKAVKGILITIPIILSGFLAFNIYEYSNTIKENKNIKNRLKENNEKVLNINNANEETEKKLNTLKEEKKDKIKEYERWLKWEKDIKEKIN